MAQPRACAVSISPQYFQAAGTRVVQGRPFSDEDHAGGAPVVIVNQAFAQQYFRGDALGRQFQRLTGHTQDHDQYTRMTIVGIVKNVRYNGLTGTVTPAMYLPFEQAPQGELNLLLRTTVVPGSLTSAMRKAVAGADPDQPLFAVETMEQRVSQSVAQRRMMMR
jgi:hypothetical protein